MPQAPKELEALGALQRNLAQAAMQAVQSSFKSPWKAFNVEICTTPDGSACTVKFLVIPMSGAPVAVRTGKPVLNLVSEIWKMRAAFDPHGWRAMNLNVNRAGACKIDFKYDPDRPQEQKTAQSMESAILSQPPLQQAMGNLVQTLLQAAPAHYAMIHLLVDVRQVDGRASILFTHGSPVLLNEYTTLVSDSIANAAFGLLDPLMRQDASFPGFEVVLRKTADSKWDVQFHRLDEPGPNWKSLPRYPLRVCGYGLSLAPAPDKVFRWVQNTNPGGIIAAALPADSQAPQKQVQIILSDTGNRLSLGQGVAKAEEVIQVAEGPDTRKWMIETPIFRTAWPNGFDLRFPLASKTRFDLVGPDNTLIFVQGPATYQTRLLDMMASEGQREFGRGKTPSGHDWIELEYDAEGTKWRQRHYARKISSTDCFVVTAQCAQPKAVPIFQAADEVTESLSAPPN